VRHTKGFVIRIFLFSAVLVYLAGDLFLFNGPLRRRIQRGLPDSPESIAAAKAQGIVARVLHYPILDTQLERATKERLWLRGKKLDELTPQQRRVERLAALEDLIDHQLLRIKTKHNATELPVAEAEVDDALKRLAARFESRDAMQEELTAEGIDSEKELRLRIGARLQQQKYVESRIAPNIAVTEDEARAWHESHAKELARPERIEARHVFLSTLGHDAAEARATLQKALDELTAKTKDFPALAAELSGDPRTKAAGGNLGWLTKDRLPADFAAPLFALPLNLPSLLRTKLGWHLVEVTARKPAEPRSFEDARAEVMAALEAVKRREATREFRKALRGQEGRYIEVFADMIPE
jgi:parvulin-like peptidyl-prolyl isomerase